MKHPVKWGAIAVAILIGALLGACAGVGIVATSDPLAKLNDAEVLFGEKNRPVPAENLIREAIGIYRQRDDAAGLGNAFREYADFLTSPAVSAAERMYRKPDGFLDKSITFDNRDAKAAEFYELAIGTYQRAESELRAAQRFDALTNVYFNMAWSHRKLGKIAAACVDYDHTIEAYQENMRLNPSARPYVGHSGGALPAAVATEKNLAGCNAKGAI